MIDVIYRHMREDKALQKATDGRIYPLRAAKSENVTEGPIVTYQLISQQIAQGFAGPTGGQKSRLQIACWANSYDTARKTADMVTALFDRFDFHQDGRHVSARRSDQRDLDAQDVANPSFGVVTDFDILHSERTAQ